MKRKRLVVSPLILAIALVVAPVLTTPANAADPTIPAEATATPIVPNKAGPASYSDICLLYAYIQQPTTYTLRHRGSQNCNWSGLYTQSITVEAHRCTFMLAGVCITWAKYMGWPTCNKVGGGWLYCPGPYATNWDVLMPGEGHYKTKVYSMIDTTSGKFYGEADTAPFYVPNP